MTSQVAAAEVAQPYAQALLSIAQSKNLTEEFGKMRGLSWDCSEQTNSYTTSSATRLFRLRTKALIKQILGEGSNPYLRNFLLILVDKRRIAFLESIFQQYLALLRQLNQTVLAEVISAVPLTEAQQQAIIQKVIAISNARQVELETKVDSELIGGVIIKVGSQVIDASIRGQLRRLSLRLTNS